MVVLTILICFASACLKAGELSWQLRNYTKSDGLAQNAITAITEDRSGMMWIGTQNGIHRFDGYEFEIFHQNVTKSALGLQSDYIRNLLVSHNGDLWVGTASGLHLYSFEKNQFIPIEPNIHFGAVQDIVLSPSGEIWVAMTNGLFRVEVATKKLIPSGYNNQNVTSIKVSKGGIYVVLEENRIEFMGDSKSVPKLLFNVANNQTIYGFEVIDETNLVVATNYGLVAVKPDRTELLFTDILPSVMAAYLDINSVLWVTTGNALFQIESPLKYGSYPKIVQANFDVNQVLSFFVDSSQQIWLGTQNDGLFLQARNSSWIEAVTDSGSEGNSLSTIGTSVAAIDIDSAGDVWQGSNEGIAKLDWNNNITTYYPLGMMHDGISSQISVIEIDSGDDVWVGYRNGPLAKFNAKTKMFESQTSDLKLFITDIIELNADTLLFTTRSNGVFTFDKTDKKLDQFSTKTVTDPSWITNRFQTSLKVTDELVWLGSFDSGLFLFNISQKTVEKHFGKSETAPFLPGNLVVSLMTTDENNLYVGTTNGLSLLDISANKIDHFTHVPYLTHQTIYGIVQDRDGFIWLTTDSGIIRLEPSGNDLRVFSIEDGLPNNEFNSNSLFQNDQFIYAGGVGGVAKLDTSKIPSIGNAPEVYLSDLYLFGKKVVVGDESKLLSKSLEKSKRVALDYFQNAFSIGFGAINFQTPLKVKYKYQLQPFDQNWTITDHKRRLATYTNLDPGTYIFSVQASIDGVNWSEPKALQFDISPAPWASPFAYFIYLTSALFILSLVLILVRRKRQFEQKTFQQISKKEQELSLALWGSGDEFWNFNVRENTLHRRNSLGSAEYREMQSGDDFEAHIHPDDAGQVRKALTASIFESIDSFEVTYRLKDKAGKWFWVLGKGTVSERDPVTGRPTLISGANKNIDELKRAEEALTLANDELEEKVKERTFELVEANKEITQTLFQLKSMQEKLVESEKMASLGNMVAGVAHEINTPLGVAITSLSYSEKSMGELLERAKNKSLSHTKFSKLGEETMTGLLLAQRNLSRAGELVNSFKQVSVDQSSEQIREFNLKDLVDDTVATLRPKFKNTEFSISADVPDDIKMTSYPGLLSQVLVNFITNSLTHGFKGMKKGSIVLSASYNSQDSIILIYKDSGIGIDEANWEKVFEPFFTTNRNKGNTGLGMHISYNLVTQKLGGDIVLNSRLGDGVEIYINLPIKVKSDK